METKERSGGDDELFELVRSFVEDLSADVDAMRSALTEGNLEGLAMLAHRLKGAAGSYGFPALTRQAATLERCVRGHEERDAIVNELESLSALCAVARAERRIS